jgi:subtilisin family serine protease
VPNEVVISGLDAAALQRLADERFQVLAQRTMASRPSIIARVRVPNGMPMPRALSRARELAPGAAVDRNHVFSNTFLVQTGPQAARRAFANPLAAVAWPKDASCSEDARIGIVDTGIDPEHPTLKDKSIERETVRGPDLAPSSTDHGTAVATLLVGDGHFAGLAPGARLIAVDAFHRHENRDRADAFDLVSAIELLVERKVSVINLSLAGGANELLDRAGKEALAKNVLIVAAVGNEGPASPPLYPAAYSWAVAVTAVDDGRIAYARAVRGRHVSFAAPGVRLAVDDGNGQARTLSGTSFAAPFLTAAIAQLRGAHPDLTPAEVVSALTGRVVDLGAPGRDNIFGWGLLHLANRCTLRPARE